jgi:hypothetical protein
MTNLARELGARTHGRTDAQADERTSGAAYRRTGVPAYRRTGAPAYRRTDEGGAERDLGAAVRDAVVRAFERVFGFAAVERLAQIP